MRIRLVAGLAKRVPSPSRLGQPTGCTCTRPARRLLGLLAGIALLPLVSVGLAQAEPSLDPDGVSAAPPAAPAPLEDLIDVPRHWRVRSEAAATDEALAAAVRAGTNPDLQRRSNFRKRSVDLFRTERELEIGDKEMLLRLRLRAKQREAVRVELKF